ncbi:MAG: hypothetical protein ACREIQ_01385, partial [Nitrospiria bacterium]
LWSPQWLKFFGKIRIGQKETYNASATPTFDTRAVAPRVLNPKDLQDLRDAMQEVVKQAEARDPAALRRRIGQLEKELKTRRTEIQVERVEVPVLKESQVEQLRQSINSLAEMGAQLVGVAQDLGNALARVTNQSAIPESQKEVSPLRPEPVTTQPAGDSGVSLRAGERRMLEALGRRYPAKLTRTQLATLSRFSVRGGTFSTYFGTLKRAGFLNEIGSDIQITQTGLDYLGYAAPPPAQTAEELLDMWRGSLRAGERKMLDELVSVYPKSLGRAGLAYRAGYEVSGGTFGTYLSTLRRNGLVDVVGDEIRASDTLFL